MSEKTDRIVKTKAGKFQVMSKAGKPLGDPYDSEEEASERLRQIEAAVAAKGDSGAPRKARRIDYLGEIHFDPERTDGVIATVDDATGFLRLDARLTRTGVFQYGDRDGNTWGELRTEDEVFDEAALRSFEMVVLTDDHPAEFVTAANVRDVQVGHVGSDVRRDGDFVIASIVVTDAKAIAAIRDGKRELSCGYSATVLQDSGETDAGTPFAGRQTQIRGNHVAIVDRGRAGPECRLLTDAGDAFALHHPQEKNPKMSTDKKEDVGTITIDGEKISVDPRVAAAFTKLTEDSETEPSKDQPMPTQDTKTEDATALRARLDVLEAEATARAASESARIDARVSLVTTARNVLGADTPTTGVTDAALMRAVVLKVNPALEGRLDANKDAPGYLRAAFDAAVDLHGEREAHTDEAPAAIFEAIQGGKTDADDLDALHASYIKDRNTIRLTAGEG
jgi:hypothetical protein